MGFCKISFTFRAFFLLFAKQDIRMKNFTPSILFFGLYLAFKGDQNTFYLSQSSNQVNNFTRLHYELKMTLTFKGAYCTVLRLFQISKINVKSFLVDKNLMDLCFQLIQVSKAFKIWFKTPGVNTKSNQIHINKNNVPTRLYSQNIQIH